MEKMAPASNFSCVSSNILGSIDDRMFAGALLLNPPQGDFDQATDATAWYFAARNSCPNEILAQSC
jgi:hypothetical protein